VADAFVAEIRIFPFNFPPTGWAFCNGQLLPISQNTALFSLLGTFYGGDGRTNFALPNLQGCAPMAAGQGPGLSLRTIGETGGTETVTLLTSDMPSHPHSMRPSVEAADIFTGTAATAIAGSTPTNAYIAAAPDVQLNLQAVAQTGNGVPHNNIQPSLVLNFCIALQGIFPPRT
jgi:microcystin-dependent protein